MSKVKGANNLIEEQLAKFIKKIARIMDGDCLTYIGPIAYGADDRIRDSIEALSDENQSKNPKLIFILQTEGGFAEVARRISDALRHHYAEVEFLVPSHAMSAGTILTMSGDAIWMDYYSVLGPIDPQVPSADGRKMIPALGYLEKYNQLLDKSNKGEAQAAELQILLGFDQGELYSYEQARDLSISLLEEWLAKYKFKNWVQTETKKTTVTPEMRQKRAAEIATKLNKIDRWNSHGIGINKELLSSELGLRIDDFGENDELRDAVRQYHKLLTDYMQKLGHYSVVHTSNESKFIDWQ